jgi:hypothetical protein
MPSRALPWKSVCVVILPEAEPSGQAFPGRAWEPGKGNPPHPNPLPEGEGAELLGLVLPAPLGRGIEGEGLRARISAAQLVLR